MTSDQVENNSQKVLCNIGAVANYFIDRSRKDHVALTNLSMQKLVYFAYGWIMGYTNERLFYDRIEAWRHGPVVPSLYHQLKQYGHNQISRKLVDYDYDKKEFFSWNIRKETALRKMMRKVWNRYKALPPQAMTALTHKPGTPWSETVARSGYNAGISDELIFNHFSEILIKLNLKDDVKPARPTI